LAEDYTDAGSVDGVFVHCCDFGSVDGVFVHCCDFGCDCGS